MAVFDYLNPFILFRNYVRVPVEAFARKQYLDYKIRTNKGINSAKDLLYRAAIITLFVTAILWISVFMYVVFYYTYMPNVTHVRPVHLQFKSCEEQMGICSFPSAHVQLTKRSHMLMATQPYRIKLILDMPESQVNKDLGMFMVCAQMRAKGGVLVSSSCRSAMLRHRKCRKHYEKLIEDSHLGYWAELKKRIKGKVFAAKRRSILTGTPPQVNLNIFEQRILELAEIVANERRSDQDFNESTDTTLSLPERSAYESKPSNILIELESIPNTSQDGIHMNAANPQNMPLEFESPPNMSQYVNPQRLPLDMSHSTQTVPGAPLQVSVGTQMSMRRKTKGAKKSMYVPREHLPSVQETPSQNIINGNPEIANIPIANNMPAAAQHKTSFEPRAPSSSYSHPPNYVPSSAAPIEPEPMTGTGMAQLYHAMKALAHSNISIANALRALCGHVSFKRNGLSQ